MGKERMWELSKGAIVFIVVIAVFFGLFVGNGMSQPKLSACREETGELYAKLALSYMEIAYLKYPFELVTTPVDGGELDPYWWNNRNYSPASEETESEEEPVLECDERIEEGIDYLLSYERFYTHNFFSLSSFSGLDCDEFVYSFDCDRMLIPRCLSNCDKWSESKVLERPDLGNRECSGLGGEVKSYSVEPNCWIPIKYCLRWKEAS